MPVYEFTCAKGHVVDDLVPVGTKTIPCSACVAEMRAKNGSPGPAWNPLATRILSPTPTTFEFADRRRHDDPKSY